MKLETILSKIKGRKKIAVVVAEDDNVLKSLSKAYDLGMAEPILFGHEEKIKEVAESIKLDISNFEIINTEDNLDAAKKAVEYVSDGHADVLMKGLIATSDFFRAILNCPEVRGKGILSHVSLLDSPILNRFLILTDCAMVPYPDLNVKVNIIKNAVKFAHGIGIENPKVAALAAVEVINPKMQATLDAAELAKMNKEGLITGCIVDGPMAFDLAVSQEAVKHKGYKSSVAGDADILLFHNIEAGNSVLKALVFGGNCLFGGIVMGAKVPVIVNSRSDTDAAKLYSIALACYTG